MLYLVYVINRENVVQDPAIAWFDSHFCPAPIGTLGKLTNPWVWEAARNVKWKDIPSGVANLEWHSRMWCGVVCHPHIRAARLGWQTLRRRAAKRTL